MTQPNDTTGTSSARPSVLFVCVHNAGRSQMAAAYTRHLSDGAIEVLADGVFYAANLLYGITVEKRGGLAGYRDDVDVWEVKEEDGTGIGLLLTDYNARPSKRGGAWMSSFVDQSHLAGTKPVVVNVMSVSSNLLTIDEVTTVFHEFGHGLQHMLTRVDYPEAAGINNVEWDAVELPSQFMENWCFHEETLSRLARHVDSGEPLPKHLQDKIRAGRIFRAASMSLRQVYFATLDLELHHRYQPGGDGQAGFLEVQKRVARENTVLPPLPEDRFLCSFTHIFAGGYAAGYYSYKWAEVLSADAFSAFEEAGLSDAQALSRTGRRFRDTVLALGGSRHPLEVFQEFRGRAPSTQPLLKQTGLLETQELESSAPMM